MVLRISTLTVLAVFHRLTLQLHRQFVVTLTVEYVDATLKWKSTYTSMQRLINFIVSHV